MSNTSLLGWKGGKLDLSRKAWRCVKARSKQELEVCLFVFFFLLFSGTHRYLITDATQCRVHKVDGWHWEMGIKKNEPCFRCYDLAIGNNRKILGRDMIWLHDVIRSYLDGAKMVKRLPHLTIVEVC